VALKLSLMEKAQARRQEGDNRGRLMLRPRKLGCCPGLVVVFEESRKLILVIKAS
jgi:hypothetical protein